MDICEWGSGIGVGRKELVSKGTISRSLNVDLEDSTFFIGVKFMTEAMKAGSFRIYLRKTRMCE